MDRSRCTTVHKLTIISLTKFNLYTHTLKNNFLIQVQGRLQMSKQNWIAVLKPFVCLLNRNKNSNLSFMNMSQKVSIQTTNF